MTKWREARLGDIAYINNKNLSNKFNGLIKYLDISSVSKGTLKSYKTYNFKDAPSRARRKVGANDIIYSTVRPNLRSYYIFADKIDNNLVVSTGFVVLSVHKNYSEKYIYYYLTTESIVSYFTLIARGTSYPALGVNDFKDLKIKVPDLKTQEKIAKVLSTYDELIENNNRRIELLEQMAEEIYKEWFVRMRFPGHEETKFEKGIPEGWEVKRIGEFIPIKTGKKDANYGVENGKYLFFTCAQEPIRANDFSFNEHAILLAGNGDFNVKMYRGKFEAYQRTYVLVPYENRYIFLLYFNILENISRLTSQAAGTVIKYLTKSMIEKINFLDPSDEILQKFNSIIENIYNEFELLNQQNQNLIKQRDMLLPRLMNGTIEVE